MLTATILPMPRRRRRPAVSTSRKERLKHIVCTGLLLSGNYTAKALSRAHLVSVKTIYNWRDLALTYDDMEAEALRQMHRIPGRDE